MVCFLGCHDVTLLRGLALASLYLSSNTEGNMAVEGFECSPNLEKITIKFKEDDAKTL